MCEVWKDVEGYEGLYQISSLGRIKTCKRKVHVSHQGYDGFRITTERLLKTRINQFGYETVKLCKDNKYKEVFIHRLVAQAFICNPNNLSQVNHKDENPLNNEVDNLEWCSSKYNCNYGERNKKISESRKGIIFTEEHRKNLGISVKKSRTPEVKEKIRQGHLGKKLSDEHKKKISEGVRRSKGLI